MVDPIYYEDSWRSVISTLVSVAVLEWLWCEENGSPKCFSAGRGAAAAKLMAWRLLSKGIHP